MRHTAVPTALTAGSLALTLAACVGGSGTDSVTQEVEVCNLAENDFTKMHDDGPFLLASTTVTNTTTHLLVQFDAAPGHVLADVRSWPTLTVPTSVNYTLMPYKAQFTSNWPTSHTLQIPLADLDIDSELCSSLFVTSYVKVLELGDAGTVIDNYGGFVGGQHQIGTQHAWAQDYTFCCEPPEEEEGGCTLTIGYWKTHNEYATRRPLRIDWPAPLDEDDLLCGERLLDILATPPQGEAWYILAHQYIGAILNVAAGASSPIGVDDALDAAEAILTENCGGIPDELREEAVGMGGLLDDYNNGVIGPGHCE